MKSLARRVKLMILRAVVKVVNDSGDVQLFDIDGPLSGESHTEVIHHQIYGLSVSAPVGSIPVVLSVGGNRSNLTAINPAHSASRPKDLKTGEVIIYSQHGQHIKLLADGTIEIKGNTRIVGDLTVTGDTSIEGDFVAKSNVNLGGLGGEKIARRGDRTSDGATITEGSDKVRAA